jgi:hypothetical protein
MAKARPQRKPPTAAKAASSAKPSVPLIDTTFAVQAAAAMVGKGVSNSSAAPRKESSTFKQLKEGLTHSNDQTLGKVLDQAGGPATKRSSQPVDKFGRQIGHNQTFGGDVNRSGVPRRTAG